MDEINGGRNRLRHCLWKGINCKPTNLWIREKKKKNILKVNLKRKASFNPIDFRRENFQPYILKLNLQSPLWGENMFIQKTGGA